MRGQRDGGGERIPFSATVRLFLDACPGPPLLRMGLAMAALQRVDGIPGLDGSPLQAGLGSSANSRQAAMMQGGGGAGARPSTSVPS